MIWTIDIETGRRVQRQPDPPEYPKRIDVSSPRWWRDLRSEGAAFDAARERRMRDEERAFAAMWNEGARGGEGAA